MGGIIDHMGFHVREFAKSRAFYERALAPLGICMLRGGDNWGMLGRGGKDNGGPGLRPYHPNYYGAFVIDPDGHNVEAVCHAPEG